MRRPFFPLLLAAALTALALAPGAGASYEPLGQATTTISLAGPFAKFLRANGIALRAVAPARVKGPKLSLPLAAGRWDPTTGKGEVESAGAIVLQGGRGKLPIKALTVKANQVPLTAKVGGGQLKLATAKQVSSKRSGFGSAFQARQLRLTEKLATRLNKKLRPRTPFQANQPIGTLEARSAPQLMDVLPEGRLGLELSPTFLAKLQSLFVSLNPIFPAEHPGPFTFPIAVASTISPDGAQGTIRTEGELELLLLGSGQLFWGQQWLDLSQGADLIEANLQPSPPFGGKQAQGPLFALSLAGAQIVPDAKSRSVAVKGASLALTQVAADQLNQLLAGGKGVFAAGEGVGVVSFTARGE